MRAIESYFLRFLQTMPQFVVPTYQRPYSWGKRECAQLWDDIVAAGSNDAIKTYFLGAIVYVALLQSSVCLVNCLRGR